LAPRERANHVADGVRSLVIVPIVVNKETLGCLVLYSAQTRRFKDDTVRFGTELAEHAAHAIDRARLFRQLRVRAETDGLTTLLNHRAAFETLDRELRRAREDGGSVGVIVVDLDDFKLFNDTHGHLVGDRVLVEVSSVLKQTVRRGDHVARYGGDEFLVILPGANPLAVKTIAQEIVAHMHEATVNVDGLHLPIRCSVGVANFPRDARTRPELIAFADSSMYAAKELGGGQVGSIHRGTRSLEVSTLGALSGLVRAVDRKDRYTKDHSDLVAEYSVRFGKAMGLPSQKLEALELAGQLHDVGKIAVPDSILRKPGHLTPDEEGMIRQHVVFSELMIKGVPHLNDVLDGVGHHHERWDGLGYPYGKSGVQIPLLGRILAFADALAAMTYDRPYRKGRSLQQAVEEIRKGAGTQFDPDLVEPFIAAVTSQTGQLSDAARRSTAGSGFLSSNMLDGHRMGLAVAGD
jgi:diguanylate cyclase (GGDEF)-like protein